MTFYNNIYDAFGNTPLVKLQSSASESHAEILAKLEFFNPGSSVKDRLGVALVRAAEESGGLAAGGTLVEATSGNTGIALAWIGAAKGYRVVLAMPASMSEERKSLLRILGAELVLTEPAKGMAGALAEAERIVAETPGAVLARQFENEANPAIHRTTTAEEIWRDTEGNVDILVAGIGTGGTITGVGQRLKELSSELEVIAVEPEESPVLSKGTPGPHKIQGIGPNFVPPILDRSVIDEIFTVNFEEALDAARALARQEGILAGISSGAALHAALSIAARPENAGKRLVVIFADTGERYISTPLFEPYRA